MAKKKIEVDEDMLKEIMAGDIPIFALPGTANPVY